jgi:hypothetical protein
MADKHCGTAAKVEAHRASWAIISATGFLGILVASGRFGVAAKKRPFPSATLIIVSVLPSARPFR